MFGQRVGGLRARHGVRGRRNPVERLYVDEAEQVPGFEIEYIAQESDLPDILPGCQARQCVIELNVKREGIALEVVFRVRGAAIGCVQFEYGEDHCIQREDADEDTGRK
ncbi:MAG: hypothetical protein GWP08_01545 [Nitrospiraceae bacterium]|nr:hypothetical protein [Nitrospiraceae bacterium]